MSSGGWLPRTVLAVLLVTASYHTWRLRAAFPLSRSGRQADLVHAFMAVLMAWMVVAPIHGSVATCLIPAAALGAAWFAVAAVRGYIFEAHSGVAQMAGLALGWAAMSYMLVAMSEGVVLHGPGLTSAPAASPGTAAPLASAHSMAMPTMPMTGVATTPGRWWIITVVLLTGVSAVAIWTVRLGWVQGRSSRSFGSVHHDGLVAAGFQLAMSTSTAYMLACLL